MIRSSMLNKLTRFVQVQSGEQNVHLFKIYTNSQNWLIKPCHPVVLKLFINLTPEAKVIGSYIGIIFAYDT